MGHYKDLSKISIFLKLDIAKALFQVNMNEILTWKVISLLNHDYGIPHFIKNTLLKIMKILKNFSSRLQMIPSV